MFVLCHLSDLHATAPGGAGLTAYGNKRLLGWLSWKLRRRRLFRPEVLEALIADIRSQKPDHIAVTGDLINLALDQEYTRAVSWLERLGPPNTVTVVPGNHDAYVRVSWERSWARWRSYMASDEGRELRAGECPFPTLRVRGDVALVGLSTAMPTPPLFATGRVGEEQLQDLERRLRETAREGLCRVLLLHHSPHPGAGRRRRRLRDARALGRVLARAGAELVLYGHRHLRVVGTLPGPQGAIPSLGVSAASYGGNSAGREARYHLCRIARSEGERGYAIEVESRVYDRERGVVRAEGTTPVLPLRGTVG